MTFNSVENIADQLVDCAYAGRGLFDDVEVYSTMTKQALEERLQKQLCAQRCSLSVIRPVE